MSMTKNAGSETHPDPLVRSMDPRIQIRIHTKMSWIRNTAQRYAFSKFTLFHSVQNYLIRIWFEQKSIWFTRQIKGRWESNINAWFPFMYSQKWNCYFQNRIIMFCLPFPTIIYLWEIYIFPGSACLFCNRKICGSILEIYKSLTDTWMWKLGLRPRNSQKRNA